MISSVFRVCMLLLLFGLFLNSCKKETFITSPNARVNITADSVKFDTVFTTVGSVTQSFKIINENDQKLLLTSIKLMGGTNSAFKININGVPTVESANIEIAANDSIYVFVSVTVNPTATNLPFIISDSIQVNYNGNNRFVQLEAFGLNAHFLRDELISANTTWLNDLPYVILGSLRVDTTASLTIEAGSRIYIHANAPVLIDGSLRINGTKNNEVIFTGDRLDENYRDLPASWPGIYLRNSSRDNQFTFAIIKNADQAVVVQNPAVNSNPKLLMQQCIITNAFTAGLRAINTDIDINNTLISNCGSNINIQLGGNYNFTHCTVASYSNIYLLHQVPVLQVANFTEQNGALITADINASFRNCIFWGDGGNIDDEMLISKEGNNVFNVSLENCLYKAINDPANTTLSSVIRNQDPVFDSIDIGNNYFDFRFTKDFTAPAIDNGILTTFPKDLDDLPRANGNPDIGSYEKQ